MLVGCNTVAFRKYSLDFALERIARGGYKYVEVEANLSWCDHTRTDQDDPVKFREKVLGSGLTDITCIGSHRELISEATAEEDLKHSLEFAAAAKVPVVATGEGRLPEGMSPEEALKILRPKMERLAQVAERCKVHLAIEPHGSLSLSPGGIGKIITLAPSPWVGVNFDTANPHRGDYVGTTHKGFEWKLDQAAAGDELAVLRPVADKVVHVHFKDVVGRNAVVLGTGEVKLKEELEIMRQAGYDGALSYETEGWEEAEESQKMIEASLVFTRKLLADLGIKY
ncbi:MAG TPA: TIM barrel protein [bacterium]|nr:TIM barrel protein [bacterium]